MAVQSRQKVFIYLSLCILLWIKCFTFIYLMSFCAKWIRNAPNKISFKYGLALELSNKIFSLRVVAQFSLHDAMSITDHAAVTLHRHVFHYRIQRLSFEWNVLTACVRCNNTKLQIIQVNPIKQPLKHHLLFSIMGWWLIFNWSPRSYTFWLLKPKPKDLLRGICGARCQIY